MNVFTQIKKETFSILSITDKNTLDSEISKNINYNLIRQTIRQSQQTKLNLTPLFNLLFKYIYIEAQKRVKRI